MVRCASPDTLPMVGQLIPLMINKLNETLQAQAGTSEALERQSEIQVHPNPLHSSIYFPSVVPSLPPAAISDVCCRAACLLGASALFHLRLVHQQVQRTFVCVQGLLCGVLQVIVQKLSETDATKPGVLQYGDAIMEVSHGMCCCA